MIRLDKKQLGFTLMEILIAIAIMGLLAGIGFRTFRNSQIKSRDARRKGNLSQVARALELFQHDKEEFPGDDLAGQMEAEDSAGNPVLFPWGDAFYDPDDPLHIYMSELPEDSRTGYYYEAVGPGDGYRLYTRLENLEDGSISGPYASTDCGGEDCNYVLTSPNVSNP